MSKIAYTKFYVGPPATVALTLNGEHHNIVKDAVESAQECIVLAEVLLPLGRILVAGKDRIVAAFLVVAAVHHVKEQAGVLLVKLAVAHLVNNKAGRADERREERSFPPGAASLGHPILQLGYLNEVHLQTVLAALVAKGLSQMGLAGSRLANEGEVLVGIDGGITLLLNPIHGAQ